MEKDHLIIAQVATKAAVELCVASGEYDDEALGSTAAGIQELIYTLAADASVKHGTAVVQAHFPGAQVVDFPAPAPAPTPAPAPIPQPVQAQPQAAPASGVPPQQPLHPGAALEVQWADAVVYNPQDWYDNRTSKRNPSGPDFRHKTLKQADGQHNLALWINGKAPTPAWVHERLAALPVG